ncbi:hypothetical protein BGZ46_001995 [Entomortierella lignicola]|nr:hypothetical protein BGZ46_001995 [Entomortierella lignicola]
MLLKGTISLALAADTTDESQEKIVWEDELLQDWDNGWDVDINGNPVDVNTACFGIPCTRPRLVKHEPIELCQIPGAPDGVLDICGHIEEMKTTYMGWEDDEFGKFDYIRDPDDDLICD